MFTTNLSGANDFATSSWEVPTIFDQSVDALPTDISVAEAFRMADCDYSVRKVPVVTNDGFLVPDAFTIIRDDTLRPFRVVVSDRYQPIQIRVLQDLAEQLSEHAQLVHICSLRDGARVAFTMRINNAATSVASDDDVVVPYIVGMTAHDGSMALRVQYTAVRVWCGNTMYLVRTTGTAKNSIVIPHIGEAANIAKLLPQTMDVAGRNFMATLEQLKALAKVHCTDQQFRSYLEDLFREELEPQVDGDGKVIGKKELEGIRSAKAMLAKWETGYLGQEAGGTGTWYAAMNCVTEQLTHVSDNASVESARRKLESTLMGNTQWRLERAHNLAMAAIG